MGTGRAERRSSASKRWTRLTVAVACVAMGTLLVPFGSRATARAASPTRRPVTAVLGDVGGVCNDAAPLQRRTEAPAPPPPAPITIPIVGDFNGDGRSDILSYGFGTGSDALWYASADGGSPAGFTRGPNIDVQGKYWWTAGDFNGDGRDDIMWIGHYGTTPSYIWYGRASAPPFSTRQISPRDASPVTTRFTTSAHDDVLMFNGFSYATSASLTSATLLGGAHGFSSGPSLALPGLGPAASIPCLFTEALIIADFNGDGRDDAFLYRSGALTDRVWYSNGSAFTAGPAVSVNGWYSPVVGDFTGDGRADIVWYGNGRGPDAIWYGTAHGFAKHTRAVGGTYEPVVGDFNIDGTDDILWYGFPGTRPSTLRYGGATGFTPGPTVQVHGDYEPVVGHFGGPAGVSTRNHDIFWCSCMGTYGGPDHLWYGSVNGPYNLWRALP